MAGLAKVLSPSVSLEAVIPFLHVDLQLDLYLIFSTLFIEDIKEEVRDFAPLPLIIFQKILFSFFISPNAP